jgi:hypothetical protein
MIDNYKKFTESVDDRDHYDDEYYGHNNDGMEHITYLLRTTLRNKGIDDFTVDYSGYDICISVFCYELERLKDMINIFDILQHLKTDIIPQYDSEFDMYQTKRTGGTILEFNFYYNEGNGDDFDNE